MNPWWWFLIGSGIWVFVALTLPLLISLVDKQADRDEALELVRLCWAWPIVGIVLLVAVIVIGIGDGIGWIGKGYVDILVKQPGESQPLDGKIVEHG